MSEHDLPAISDALRRDARERLVRIHERIARAAVRNGRSATDVTLVGVAKRQPIERIFAVIEAGLSVLGENFVQEARDVRPRIEAALAARSAPPKCAARDATDQSALPAVEPRAPGLTWRMVGRLQRNKLAQAVALFDAIDSVDRLELVAPLARHAGAAGRVIEVLVQVNVGDEPQKGGCAIEAGLELARAVADEPALRLCGLMTVPPATDDPEAARPYFRMLREMRDRWAQVVPALAGGALSMGMSSDFEVAIEEGATLVRVGTALFGERTHPA